jgi:hypothetical protein
MGSVGRQRQATGIGVLSSRDKEKERGGEERRRGVGWAGFRRKGLKKTGLAGKMLGGLRRVYVCLNRKIFDFNLFYLRFKFETWSNLNLRSFEKS